MTWRPPHRSQLDSVRDPRRGDAAFTLIELLVAMVLLAAVLAVGFTLLTNGLGQTGKSRQESAAISKARIAVQRLSTDLEGARAPSRDERYVGDASDLGGALLRSQPIKGTDTNGSQVTLDVQDIISASKDELVFRANVTPDAAVECVRYGRSATGAFVREVRTYDLATRRCTTLLQQEELVREVGAAE